MSHTVCVGPLQATNAVKKASSSHQLPAAGFQERNLSEDIVEESERVSRCPKRPDPYLANRFAIQVFQVRSDRVFHRRFIV